MSRPGTFAAIIVAAGRGERSGLAQPKQFAMLAGRPVLRWSVETFARHPDCAQIIVVTQDDAAAQAALAHLAVTYAVGGATRQQSVANGLAALEASAALGGDAPALVLVHDAARPALSAAVIDRLLAVFVDSEVAGAIPALPIADTLARGSAELGETVARDDLWRVQTPQAFRLRALTAAHVGARDSAATDDAQLVRAAGGSVAIVAGDPMLDKVTQPGDLERLERYLAGGAAHGEARTGMGYDVHRLVPGDGVWLGGVLIPHHQSLLGHSDADVAIHAITDALLGAVAAGDIGDHFPPSDPQWAGASSDRFLAHAAMLVTERGFAISHVDCTIICEAPRIGPHRAAMQARVAAIVGIEPGRVGIKATTTEKLGFTGRGEGIAAMAVATVRAIP